MHREVTENLSQASLQDHAIDNKGETVQEEKYLPSQDSYEPWMWHGYEKANTMVGCTGRSASSSAVVVGK